jgi:urea transport system permease protein
MAALFIGVTMAFPDGLAGLWEQKIKPWWAKRQADRKLQAERIKTAQAIYPEVPPNGKPPAGGNSLPPGMSGQQA